MATVKVKFRPSAVAGKEGTLSYLIIHRRQVRQIGSGCKLFPSEWNDRAKSIVLTPAATERFIYLVGLQDRITGDMNRLARIIAAQERAGRNYGADDVVSAYLAPDITDTLFGFMEELIARFKQCGRIRASETYATTLRSFARFRDACDIRLGAIDSDVMIAYAAYLKTSNVSKNTSSFYMRILRAVYNRAVEKELTVQKHPFKHVYTGIDKTVKRAISLEAVRRIRNMDLTRCPRLDYARAMFLFSFYTRGMSFVDMTYLKKKDLSNGILTYRRKKTGQQLCIRWERCMQEIVDKYPNGHPVYLLPVIRAIDDSERQQYKNIGHLINRSLKTIGNELGLSMPLTMYVARHTWASVARSKNIPLAVISESMGHDSEATTQIYLASLYSDAVDQANSLIIDSLSEGGDD